MKNLKIYTDGACSNNPGPGGWAAVLLFGDARKEVSGGETDTTNNRMELRAAIEGLRTVKPIPCTKSAKNGSRSEIYPAIELYSDSAYVVNAVNEGWLGAWQLNGWRTSDKKPVKNQDLWHELATLNQKYSPVYIKVKGHSDNEHNNRADQLAVAAIKKQ